MMQNVREVVRSLIDTVRLPNTKVRMFLDKSEDWSEYDVNDLRLPLVHKTITINPKRMTIKVEDTKRR